ncbi:MAG: hypothetical protein KKD69_02900 [Euryarchaeota archaeon]|nr:hypothetical protein [Euryarchaeota archaeon]
MRWLCYILFTGREKNHDTVAAVIAVTTISALIALLYFNKYPAKVFPGDTLTYPVGAIVAIVAILGNMEKSAVILFSLYYIISSSC